eukprot:2999427-Amphidinium_carterae.1
MRSSSPSRTGSGSSSGFLPFAEVIRIWVWLELCRRRNSWSTALVSCTSAALGAPSTSWLRTGRSTPFTLKVPGGSATVFSSFGCCVLPVPFPA